MEETKKTVYQVDEGGFHCVQAEKRFNRALYGKYFEQEGTRFRIFSGDLPEFLIYKKKDRGRMFFQIETEEDSALLSETAQVSTCYKDGKITHMIRGEKSCSFLLKMEVIPDTVYHGVLVRLTAKKMPAQCRLVSFFGGATGVSDERAMDPGYCILRDSKDSLKYTKDSCAGNEFELEGNQFSMKVHAEDLENTYGLFPKAVTVGVCSGEIIGNGISRIMTGGQELFYAEYTAEVLHQSVCLWVGCEKQSELSAVKMGLEERFRKAEKDYRAVCEQTVISTPSVLLNQAMRTALVATEGYWLDPFFVHGAWSWDLPILGWRSLYGPILLGMTERVRKEIDIFMALQLDAEGFCVKPQLAESVKTVFQNDSAYYPKISEETERIPVELHQQGVPDPVYELARQSSKSVFVSEGVIPSTPYSVGKAQYNMQEVFVDEIFCAFRQNGDLEWMKEIYASLNRHMRWEKRCFDPDHTGLYENYANFWASDSFYCEGGKGSIATAYNYRASQSMKELAEFLGDAEGVAYYQAEENQIYQSFHDVLWLDEENHMADWKDCMGEGLTHLALTIPTIVHCAESGILSSSETAQVLSYAEREIERVSVPGGSLFWNSNIVPYQWSVRDIDFADNFHLAMIYFQNGQAGRGWEILQGALTQSACNSVSPGAFMCVMEGKSVDFADTVSMFVRCVYEGLYGILFQKQYHRVVITPNFPVTWEQAEMKTNQIEYVYSLKKRKQCLNIQVLEHTSFLFRFRKLYEKIKKITINGESVQFSEEKGSFGNYVLLSVFDCSKVEVVVFYEGEQMVKDSGFGEQKKENRRLGRNLSLVSVIPQKISKNQHCISLVPWFNEEVCRIFKNTYEKPRTQTCSLQVPLHLYPSTWCHISRKEVECMNDSVLRGKIKDGKIILTNGLMFLSPEVGKNVVYLSKWERYPEQVSIPIGCCGKALYLFLTGYTNPMQSNVCNALFTIQYESGLTQEHELFPPFNFRTMEVGPEEERPCDSWCYGAYGVERVKIGEKGSSENDGGIYGIVATCQLKDERILAMSFKAVANDVIIGLLGMTVEE